MCDSCSWPDFLEEIEEISDDDRYGFAAETLDGIYDWVEENEHATEDQKRAVKNIRESGER
jgi:hypothetical protein